MKNLIFVCVFNNEKFIKLLYLLLESIYIFGSINENTNILIYTSEQYMNIIKDSSLYSEYIIFSINNNYNSVNLACRARLDLFDLLDLTGQKSIINDYDKILYLDTDILIKNDINKIFDLLSEDKIYALEEGSIDSENTSWGSFLFLNNNEVHNYEDKTAFSSGVMLFKNSESIKKLFNTIKEHINFQNISELWFHDQPYIVYNAMKYNLSNNKVLKEYVALNDYDIYNNKSIIHFCGAPGVCDHKLVNMTNYMNIIKDFNINNIINNCKNFIHYNMMSIIYNSGEPLEGNIFMLHNTTVYNDNFTNKQKNLCNLLLNKNIKNVLEIGFNSGFSTLLMLMTNSNVKITCCDLNDHKYTIPCYQLLKKTFGDRINFIPGDSSKTLPKIQDKYDLIHIDGGHDDFIAINDIINCYYLSKDNTILIMDDYDFHNLHELWDKYIEIYGLKELDSKIYDCPYHDIKRVVNHATL
jgi:predicted O-methyltransferase YrrM